MAHAGRTPEDIRFPGVHKDIRGYRYVGEYTYPLLELGPVTGGNTFGCYVTTYGTPATFNSGGSCDNSALAD